MNLLSIDDFKKKCIRLFGDVFDFSKTVYVNRETLVLLMCKVCGKDFKKKPVHLYQGKGCPFCARENYRKRQTYTTELFIKKAKEIHGDKYSYQKTVYTGILNPVRIQCNICKHEFDQQARLHFEGKGGCPVCARKKSSERASLTKEQILSRAQVVHGSKYAYGCLKRVDERTLIQIHCNTCGKDFWQRIDCHLDGEGCSVCKQSSGEKAVEDYLLSKGVSFEREKMFSDCRSLRKLRFDFFVPSRSLLIEYDGKHHFEPIQFGGMKLSDAVDRFPMQKARDQQKNEYAIAAGLTLVRIPYHLKSEIPSILAWHF